MRVFLRAFNTSDAEKIYPWLLDKDVQSLLGSCTYFASEDYVVKWVKEKIFDSKDIYLAICQIESKEIIGYLSIKDIDYRNRKAIWGGILLGDKQQWGKGLASEAATLMLKFVFEELNLNLFWGFWLEDNLPSIRLSEKIGFKRTGILPQSVYKGGKYQNLVIMHILKDDYNES